METAARARQVQAEYFSQWWFKSSVIVPGHHYMTALCLIREDAAVIAEHMDDERFFGALCEAHITIHGEDHRAYVGVTDCRCTTCRVAQGVSPGTASIYRDAVIHHIVPQQLHADA